MNKNDYIIRLETEKDHREVETLAREAFWNLSVPGCDEHYFIHVMRKHKDFIPELAHVIEADGKIIGCIMYTKACLYLVIAKGEKMNKGLNTLFKIVFGAIIVFGEEYLFYITLLCNVITKESSYMRLAFVFGSLVISVVNITIVYFLTRNSEFKLRNIALLIVSSVIASLGLLILSILFDKNILMEVDYKKEIDYFTILVLSSLITIWTSIFVLLLKILSKIKH